MELHYQAIVDLATSAVVGAEALLRWQHPDRGTIPPDVFIPIAERSDAILVSGAWVIEQTFHQAAAWSTGPAGALESMHVNVSAHQLVDPAFPGVVAGALRDSGVDPDVIVLELTESALVADASEAMRCIEVLKRLGVRIAIDDFGPDTPLSPGWPSCRSTC